MPRKVLLILMLASILFVSRAWDAVEIESRGYVLGVAIDEYPPMPGGQNGAIGNGDSAQDNARFGKTETDINAPE